VATESDEANVVDLLEANPAPTTTTMVANRMARVVLVLVMRPF
jgi:hypothetical protein